MRQANEFIDIYLMLDLTASEGVVQTEGTSFEIVFKSLGADADDRYQ
jgi:hypothetical protein